ncbi:MAG TPA: heavy metal-associated domain-containing protein [Candidatus Nanoarchaeia archaeon]|nr:heavy metal-associated domain-containing protein [Candidatus Nanoarchaeia archaeon]
MRTILKIAGMHCESCKVLIEEVAAEIKGVTSCTVDVKKGTAVVEHDKADMNLLKKEIEKLGTYTVTIG